MNLLETLIEQNILNSKDVASIQQEMEETGESLDTILEKRGIDRARVLGIQGESNRVPKQVLGEEAFPFDVLTYIPEESARHYQFVPLAVVDNVLEVGVTNIDSIDALDALNFISSKTGLPFKIFLISKKDFNRVLEMYKGLTGQVNEALSDLESEISGDVVKASKDVEVANVTAVHKEDEDTANKALKEDAPVTKIVATILRYAVEGNASDVHIENVGEKVRVRFRVDGILNTSLVLPAKVHQAIVARIKILSSMRLDEKRKPQDGRFTANVMERKI